MANRREMIQTLKTIVVPDLRRLGFKGTFPHFRRMNDSKIDLLTFQFDKWGGGFVIEIAQCPSKGLVTHWGAQIAPEKVTAHDLHPDASLRLQPGPSGSRDNWFRFDSQTCASAAYEVLPFLEKAANWWRKASE